MNSLIQRYLPPVIVLCAAAYFGWPPAPPLDLGDDVVRISSVQWRPDEIADPPLIRPNPDPFGEVLVAEPKMEIEPDTGKLVEVTRPPGPPAERLRAGLLLSGIADTAGKRWAVVNGRPRLSGDTVITADGEYVCQIVAIKTEHIVVQCQETVAEIRPASRLPTRAARDNSAATEPSTSAASQSPEGQLAEVPPPPGT